MRQYGTENWLTLIKPNLVNPKDYAKYGIPTGEDLVVSTRPIKGRKKQKE